VVVGVRDMKIVDPKKIYSFSTCFLRKFITTINFLPTTPPIDMKKRPGIGAVCCAPLKYMHPPAVITGKFPAMVVKQRLSGLLAIRREPRKLKRERVGVYHLSA
jgi:hypothetical protein